MKNTKKILIIMIVSIILLTSISLISCKNKTIASDNNIVGTWECKERVSYGKYESYTMTFHEDGTLTYSTNDKIVFTYDYDEENNRYNKYYSDGSQSSYFIYMKQDSEGKYYIYENDIPSSWYYKIK